MREDGIAVNAQMDARTLSRHARLSPRCETLLCTASERGLLSARGAHRVLRVARTIADLNGAERIGTDEIAEAIALRGDAGIGRNRAA